MSIKEKKKALVKSLNEDRVLLKSHNAIIKAARKKQLDKYKCFWTWPFGHVPGTWTTIGDDVWSAKCRVCGAYTTKYIYL